MEISRKKTHIQNLFAIALADNEVTADEIQLLYDFGNETGISEEEINYIIDNPHTIKYVIPERLEEKVTQLYELALMITADGKIDIREIHVFRSLCREMGFQATEAQNIVNILIEQIKLNTKKEDILDLVIESLFLIDNTIPIQLALK